MGHLNNSQDIEGMLVADLNQHVDERGSILHMLRCDSTVFRRFGEVYFSETNPGIVKAWKRHRFMTQLMAVPCGRITLALYDDRVDSPSHGRVAVHELGRPDAYKLVRIPPLVWYGFRCESDTPALLANCTDIPHDPSEAETVEWTTKWIPYQWK